MSIVLTGNPGNITTPLAATIVGLSSGVAGEVRVQTSAAHHYATNDSVFVATTGYTGTNTITVIDATHFDLNGTTFTSGTVGAGPVCQDVSLTPQVQVPTDGDTASLQLSGMLSALQHLLDRTAWTALNAGGVTAQMFSSNGTYTVPAGCTSLIVVGYGGGGGGGGGDGGSTSTNTVAMGGSGGAAAKRSATTIPVSPGQKLTVTVGAAGTAGGGGPGTKGGDGGATIVAAGASTLCAFNGGRGGNPGAANFTLSSPNWFAVVPGAYGESLGLGTSNYPAPLGAAGFITQSGALLGAPPLGPGDGGTVYGGSSSGTIQSFDGLPQYQYLGGTGGLQGTAASGCLGGAGGGGGGGGPGGPGGNGGAGGNGSGTTGGTGGTGSAPIPNSGAGGGGGGGAGCGLSSGGGGPVGGAGGSGLVTILASSQYAGVT